MKTSSSNWQRRVPTVALALTTFLGLSANATVLATRTIDFNGDYDRVELRCAPGQGNARYLKIHVSQNRVQINSLRVTFRDTKWQDLPVNWIIEQDQDSDIYPLDFGNRCIERIEITGRTPVNGFNFNKAVVDFISVDSFSPPSRPNLPPVPTQNLRDVVSISLPYAPIEGWYNVPGRCYTGEKPNMTSLSVYAQGEEIVLSELKVQYIDNGQSGRESRFSPQLLNGRTTISPWGSPGYFPLPEVRSDGRCLEKVYIKGWSVNRNGRGGIARIMGSTPRSPYNLLAQKSFDGNWSEQWLNVSGSCPSPQNPALTAFVVQADPGSSVVISTLRAMYESNEGSHDNLLTTELYLTPGSSSGEIYLAPGPSGRCVKKIFIRGYSSGGFGSVSVYGVPRARF